MAISTWASALEIKPFSPDAFAEIQQQGKPVAVHFHANWCPTCIRQAKSLNGLKTDPQLQNMTVLVADYDQEKDLRKNMKVRSQSIIVVFKGTQEITRVNGKTRADDIKAELVKAM
ncbi:thioredoxin [Lysobacter pythonis]|uniref:Thioredoxin n=2 Tax=Solilutibacter pythonis TaxID=2483112 RepID=A0A3M2HK45_9GAMM|nr:thioredoxin [Lysobacter pythonis]